MHREKKNRMIDVSCTIFFSLIHTTKSEFFFLQNDLRPTCPHNPAQVSWLGRAGRKGIVESRFPSEWDSLPGQGESFLRVILTAFSKTAVDLIRREVQWAKTPKLLPLSVQNKNQSFLSKEIDKPFPSSTIQEVVGPSVEL